MQTATMVSTFRQVSCCLPPCACADQREVEDKLEMLRAEEKRLTRLLADQGAASSSVGPGMLNAMLNLKDNKAKDTVDLYSLD